MTLIMFCSDPYFRSVDEFGKDIAGNTPMMGFPLLSSLTSGFITGLFTYPEFVYIENDGDTETFCRAVVVAYGAVTGFKLSKDVNTYVKFNQALSVGDELVLDFINASVTLNGVNANRYIDRASTFFAIDTGGCNISFSADDGTTLLSCTIYYNKLYAGV
ncbi:hypothetical protein SDC9_172780 [bioreactor metagenome]|uniref:Siphovirus-type tail component C-terminal domain-containing protein n=1 Tax=bioreactor metagenome TaxID=1076179 RepID=A0A645GEM7_9ZZZZ